MKQHYKCPQCSSTLVIDDAAKQEIKCPKCTHKGLLSTYQQVVGKERACQSCGNKWTEYFHVGESIPSEYSCPKCGSRSESTQLVGEGNSIDMYMPGILEMSKDPDGKWVGTEHSFILKRGVNTIGRMAKEPKAQITMPTQDAYMSRCHIKIEVNKLPSGVMEHLLVDNGSINGVYLNGERICPGQIVVLEADDELQLGHTTFLFRKCTPFDLESIE